MTLKELKKTYIKTTLAKKLYSKLKEIWNDENFDLGVIINCETDDNIKKMLYFIKNYSLTPKEILEISTMFDKGDL